MRGTSPSKPVDTTSLGTMSAGRLWIYVASHHVTSCYAHKFEAPTFQPQRVNTVTSVTSSACIPSQFLLSGCTWLSRSFSPTLRCNVQILLADWSTVTSENLSQFIVPVGQCTTHVISKLCGTKVPRLSAFRLESLSLQLQLLRHSTKYRSVSKCARMHHQY